MTKSKVPILFHYDEHTWGTPVFDMWVAWKEEKQNQSLHSRTVHKRHMQISNKHCKVDQNLWYFLLKEY